MANDKESDGPHDPREFFAHEIKRLRESRGWGQAELGAEINVSADYVSKLERAVRPSTPELATRLDTAFKTDGIFARLHKLAEQSGTTPSFFAYVAEALKAASRIDAFEPNLVPGLLQTPDYAREVFRAVWPFRSPERIETMVDNRLELIEAVLGQVDGPEFFGIMAESVLYDTLPPGVMDGQLSHIVDLIESNRVVMQILPADVGMHALKTGALWILALDEGAQLAYTEGPHSGHVMDSPDELADCRRSYDLVRAAALSPAASLARIKAALKEH